MAHNTIICCFIWIYICCICIFIIHLSYNSSCWFDRDDIESAILLDADSTSTFTWIIIRFTVLWLLLSCLWIYNVLFILLQQGMWIHVVRNHRSFNDLLAGERDDTVFSFSSNISLSKIYSAKVSMSWELTSVIIWSLVLNLLYWRREKSASLHLWESVLPNFHQNSTIYFLSSCDTRFSSWIFILVHFFDEVSFDVLTITKYIFTCRNHISIWNSCPNYLSIWNNIRKNICLIILNSPLSSCSVLNVEKLISV